MKNRSLRFRITAMVAAAFALVLVVSSVVFVRWFGGQLIDEVRADDSEELDRQIEILDVITDLVADDPDFVTAQDITDPGPLGSGFPLALIPDDGTTILIVNAAGTELASTAESRELILTGTEVETDGAGTSAGSSNGDEVAEIDPSTGLLLNQQEVGLALLEVELLLERFDNELTPATKEEFALGLQFLNEAFSDPTTVPVDDDGSSVAPDDERLTEMMNDLFFGQGTRSAVAEGRLVRSEREYELIGQTITVIAESRVSNIDTALDDLTRTLWFAVPALIALAAGLTYVATGRALKPVDGIIRQVQSIRSAQTGERVPVPASGDEINHLAVTMNGMLDRLEASAAGQRRFVSDVSHELRTPAAVIRAEIEAGLSDPENDWPKTAESVLNEQMRLSDLTDDLLLLARIDEGSEQSLSDIDLDDLLQSEAKRGWPHPVSTRYVEPVRVRGDARQLARMVQNLVANATRHTTSKVELTLTNDGTHAVLWVDDDGAGVPANDRERIFDRFARLEESRVRDKGGAGLGLAIVKEVAEAHGGTAIAVNSPLGGARFEVRLALGL